MNKSIVFIFIVSSLFFFSCMNKATRYLNKGRAEFQMEEFDIAAEDLKQALSYGAPKAEPNLLIAESYRLSNRMGEAEMYYRDAIEAGTNDEHAFFYYAFALKANGNYAGAESQLKKYLEYGSNFTYINRARTELKNLKVLSELAYKKPLYKVENCKEINTEAIEYSPLLHKGKLYFTSSRGVGPMFPGQGTRYTDIYTWKFDGITQFSGAAVPLNTLINQEKTHEATSTFSPDGKTMIFSRSNSGKKKDATQEVDLFETKFENGDWSEPKMLPICEVYSWDSNPALSPDGKTLYFSSNRDGGFGGDDIWKATLNEDSLWDNVENLGETINTDGHEQFPYVAPDGTLYFSSDGHPSFGGLDLYAYLKDPETGKMIVRNLGKPINSSSDDFAISLEDLKTGYFASNRPGGKGDDDIYYFHYIFEPKYMVEGVVKGKKTEKETEKEVLLPNAAVTVSDTLGNVIQVLKADSLANFKFEVETEKVYVIKGEKEGYITRQIEFSTIGKTIEPAKLALYDKDIVFKTKVVLDVEAVSSLIAFAPIYYPYNKWEITLTSRKILDDMVQVMNDNPKILVELGSHTDPRGTLRYNDTLSIRRAEAAVDYILKQGIPKERITAKGYGERVNVILQSDTAMFKAGTKLTHNYLESIKKDKKAFELGNQLNRRTEFKIIGFIQSPVDPKHIQLINKGEKEEIKEEEKLEREEELINKYLKKK